MLIAMTDSPTRVRVWRVFMGFLKVGLSAFGGGLNAHLLALVRREGWLDDRVFAELSTFAQTLPGSNNGNLSVLLGYRLSGVQGAAAALAGLLLPGSLMMLAVSVLFVGGAVRLSGPVEQALSGAAAAAFGISVAAALGILKHTFRTPLAVVTALLTCALALALHDGTLIALLVLVPLGMLLQRPPGRRGSALE